MIVKLRECLTSRRATSRKRTSSPVAWPSFALSLLEAIDVEDDQRQRVSEARVALDLVDPQDEVAPVVELGELVLEREILEPRTADRDRRVWRATGSASRARG